MQEADVLLSTVSIHRTRVGKSRLGALDNGAPTIGKCERKVGGVSERRESVMLNHVQKVKGDPTNQDLACGS
jgi:hypothetical protein